MHPLSQATRVREGQVERDVQPRVAIVTGASAGIGRGIAEHLGRLGWSVAVGARRLAALEETAALVREAGGTAFPHVLDVADAGSVETFFAAAESELGPAAVVVNNAAVGRYGPMWEFSPEEIRREVETKLIGSLYVTRRGIRSMIEHDVDGDILFITSIAAATPWPHHLPYAAAGAGLEHAARTLKLELEGTRVRVHTLRCDSTLGTEFALRELEAGRLTPALRVWFNHGLVRHGGYLTVDQVADAAVDALCLPRGLQYDIYTLTPTAPTGPLPESWSEFEQLMAETPGSIT
jgi:NAD(P)-dependent dehydrogenase (short-subunit alcohol dehydrogenase family)